jgi:hypothetical protein
MHGARFVGDNPSNKANSGDDVDGVGNEGL